MIEVEFTEFKTTKNKVVFREVDHASVDEHGNVNEDETEKLPDEVIGTLYVGKEAIAKLPFSGNTGRSLRVTIDKA